MFGRLVSCGSQLKWPTPKTMDRNMAKAVEELEMLLNLSDESYVDVTWRQRDYR